MKKIDTLVEDIYGLFTNPHEFQEGNVQEFGQKLAQHISNRISEERGKPSLRLSNLGTPCDRKLWYSINTPELAEPLAPEAQIKFLFGDIMEEMLLFLAKEAGHTVEGQQDEVSINGVKGHRDAVIDGRLVDVKSASPYSFKKFEANDLPGNDSFGYLTQLGGYLHASQEDDIVKDKEEASFLVIEKVLGKITLDTYKFPKYNYYKVVDEKREMLNRGSPPDREFGDVAEGKSGNRKLAVACSYCPFKRTCWPGLRTYLYSSGPTFLTYVAREPKVMESI